MTSNTAPLVQLTQGDQVKGYVQTTYTFEDNEGIVWINSYGVDMLPADGILNNFTLTIKHKQNEI